VTLDFGIRDGIGGGGDIESVTTMTSKGYTAMRRGINGIEFAGIVTTGQSQADYAVRRMRKLFQYAGKYAAIPIPSGENVYQDLSPDSSVVISVIWNEDSGYFAIDSYDYEAAGGRTDQYRWRIRCTKANSAIT